MQVKIGDACVIRYMGAEYYGHLEREDGGVCFVRGAGGGGLLQAGCIWVKPITTYEEKESLNYWTEVTSKHRWRHATHVTDDNMMAL